MKNVSKATNNKTANLLFLMGVMLSLTLFQVNNARAENSTYDPLQTPKIINGETSEKGAWPWMAALLRTDASGSNFQRQFCGGTLIATQWVLTAAHCVTRITDIEVLLGENDLYSNGGETIAVTNIVIHPNYNAETKNADLALLKLASPSSIEPVSVAYDFDFKNEKGRSALALGWGITYQGLFTDTFPSNLQQVNFTIESDEKCDSTLSSLPELENIICLGTSEEKDTCQGDSGGPLLIKDLNSQSWKQIGITSFGTNPCALYGGYGVYTQIDEYNQFITATIGSTTVSTQDNPEDLLAKCATKYPEYAGQKDGTAFSCNDGARICQNTTGGSLMNVTQLAVLSDNEDEVLEYFDASSKQWSEISFASIGYCD